MQESMLRVRSLSSLHEKLYHQEGWGKVQLQEYLEDLLGHMKSSFEISSKVRFQLDFAPGIDINMDQAISLGLLFNEMLSNAYKFAFAEHHDPVLKVCLQALSKQTLRLMVEDNGRGMSEDKDLDSYSSVCLPLIYSLAQQLKGQLRHENLQPGLRYTLDFQRL